MNPLTGDAPSLGCLTPGSTLLQQLLQQSLGATPLLIRSGGTTSRCAGDGCWTLDLRRHRHHRYLQGSRQIEFGAGLTMAELLQRLRAVGRSLPIGLSGRPGSGFILTGGMGPLSRSQGLAVDHITAIEGCWGSGEPFVLDLAQRQSSDPHSMGDRWRALLGAAPFLAVVTGLRLRTQPLQPLQLRRGLVVPSQLPELLRIAEQWPDTCSLQWTWGDLIEIYAVDCGAASSRSLQELDPILGSAPGTAAHIWRDQLDLPAFGSLAAEQAPAEPMRCEVLGRLGPAIGHNAKSLMGRLEDHMQHRPHRSCSISAQQLGGATMRIAPDSTSFVHRDAIWKPWITAAWAPGDQAGRERSLDWMQQVSNDFRLSCPGVHLAQLHDHLPSHQQELIDAYGDWLPKLRALKSELDPRGQLPPL